MCFKRDFDETLASHLGAVRKAGHDVGFFQLRIVLQDLRRGGALCKKVKH